MDAKIKDLAWTALPVAILYFSGTIYISSYLARFGIDWTEAELSLQEILIFSFKVITYPLFLVMFLVFNLLVVAATWGGNGRQVEIAVNISPLGKISVGAVSIFAGFAFLYLTGKAAGDALAEAVWDEKRAKYYMTLSKKSFDEIVDADIKASISLCLERRNSSHIFSDGKMTFVLCRSSNNPRQHGVVYSIVNNEVIGIRSVNR
ncbi:hypothetical protein [Aurantimonas sp. A3-2-R12]|uniref:hypothetical protein n=1 Tax=Aurantimonas sp. A3-2-R12 TaxID=3114362 RepID=UPI002E19CA7A|nr:hypothetical protein [Aurantimonas sp. A3-2-R12]